MKRLLPFAFLLMLVAVGVVALATGGDEPVRSTEVRVGGVVIGEQRLLAATEADLADLSWQSYLQTGQEQTVDHPGMRTCVSEITTRDKASKQTPQQRRTQARAKCDRYWDDARRNAATQLIQQEWFRQEIVRRRLRVTERDLSDASRRMQAAYARGRSAAAAATRKQLPKGARRTAILARIDRYYEQYPQFTDHARRLGTPREALLAEVRAEASRKVLERDAGVDHVFTDKEVREEYARQRSKLRELDVFTFRALVASERDRVEDALEDLRDGRDFDRVFSRYNTDPTLAPTKGRLASVSEDKVIPALRQTLRTARPGRWYGPVTYDQGFALVRLEHVRRGKRYTYAEARTYLRDQLTRTRSAELYVGLQERYQPRTVCGEQWAIEMVCSDYRAPEQEIGGGAFTPVPTTSAPTTSAPTTSVPTTSTPRP